MCMLPHLVILLILFEYPDQKPASSGYALMQGSTRRFDRNQEGCYTV